MATLNLGSEGMGGNWGGYDVIIPLLRIAFPNVEITTDTKKPVDLYVRSRFTNMQPAPPYSCPYICFSGEARNVHHKKEYPPIIEVNTAKSGVPNEFWFPYLVAEIKETKRNVYAYQKKWCCAYALSNPIQYRERVFNEMRRLEKTCYAFGGSCTTKDNPIDFPKNRHDNFKYMGDFAFNIAMENQIAPGYVTEKIGHAFLGGTVPIYWGDAVEAKELFNPESFICVNDFESPEAAAACAVEVWKDPAKLKRYLEVPIVVNDKLSQIEDVYRGVRRPWMDPFIEKIQKEFSKLK